MGPLAGTDHVLRGGGGIWADWLHHQLLYAVPHRQFVFTVPKRLRPFFLYDRRLLGLLSRVAARTLGDFMRTTLREPEAVPGIVSSIQTFGSLTNFHPHLHLLVTDGVFRSDGTFVHLGFHEIEVLSEAFRRAVLREFVRLQYNAQKRQVRLTSDKYDGPTVGTHSLEALEFLAQLLTHVPNKNEVLVRYYGAYSVRRRAAWRAAGILTECGSLQAVEADTTAPRSPQSLAMRRRWAELLQRIFEVDPLRCPRCGAEMRILAFVLDQHTVQRILRHLRKSARDPRSVHTDDSDHFRSGSRAPPE